MPQATLPDELAQQAVDQFTRLGSKIKASAFIGIPVTTFKHRLAEAQRRGFKPSSGIEVYNALDRSCEFIRAKDDKRLPVLRYEFDPKDGVLRIVPLGCIHVGHKNFNKEKAERFRDYIIKTRDTYTIMMGDTVENVLAETAARHPGSMHEQNLDVEEQRETAYQLLKPLAESGKILGWLEANHSLRSWYAAGFSVERHLANKLSVPFLDIDGLFKIKVGKQRYSIHTTHGVGSSTTYAAVIKKLEEQMARIEGADVYIRSHHHKKVLADFMRVDGVTGRLRKKIGAATGCFMEYFGSYGHRAGYSPTVMGCVKVKLYSERWDLHATL